MSRAQSPRPTQKVGSGNFDSTSVLAVGDWLRPIVHAVDNEMVSKQSNRTPRRTFADIVEEIETAPPPPLPAPLTLTAPDGSRFYACDRTLDTTEAAALVADGARVAWDSCGSMGYAAAIEWFEPSDGPELIRSGPPEVRDRSGRHYRGRGELTEWRTKEGTVLVLASQDVRWGRFMCERRTARPVGVV